MARWPANHDSTDLSTALVRFKKFCRFEPETGCVVWVGGTTAGRGHHVRYPAFWYAGRRWFGHRWSAKHIHGHDISEFQVDHCCPGLPRPNTLCVQHVKPTTARINRLLQDIRRQNVHLQVGLLRYYEIYGFDPEPYEIPADLMPFFTPPAWLDNDTGPYDATSCPF